MGINIRQKGQSGEREVAQAMNAIVRSVLTRHNLPIPDKDVIQRNQNQSAVGGGDLSNCFGICPEVKRQEALSVNTWWKQCEKSAEANSEVPVLIYRQNGKKWLVVMYSELPLCIGMAGVKVRCTISWEDFLTWFYHWVNRKIGSGEVPRT